MSATWKNNIEISIFGESHGKAIGVVLGNIPSGIVLDMDAINHDMERRAPGKNQYSTARKEADEVQIMAGVLDGVTTGAPIMAMIENKDQHSKDYSLLKTHMRPGHSDYPAYVKYHGFNDIRGGGHFSGRITAPIVFAGAVAKQILKQKGIQVVAHVQSIKDIVDESFEPMIHQSVIDHLQSQQYPVLDDTKRDSMLQQIDEARMNQDSVGGSVQCAIIGLPTGLGDPFFDSLESKLSSLLFSIPGIKGVHFGNTGISSMIGSQANDAYYYQGDQIQTKTNNNGGILGGITTGMPVVFTTAIKPTPSISKTQATINIETKENTTMEVHGRHDPCIVFRALVVVEAMAALCALDATR